MTDILMLLLLGLVHFLTGYGILHIFRIRLVNGLSIPLAVMVGVGVASFLPFFLQLAYIPITAKTVFSSLAITALLLNIPALIHYKTLQRPRFSYRVKLYELPALAVIALMVFVSVWRCYYLPVTPRDMLSGPEVIAEYAVKEHTLINSLFRINLETTNNQFKPPFVIALQVIYKLAGFPFGSMWLSFIFTSFICFLYRALTERIHPVFAGLLVIFFMAIPEMYGYTFMALFDYSNAVFLFLCYYFLFAYFRNGEQRYFFFSALLMGIATYIRPETLIIAAMTVPAILWVQYRAKLKVTAMAYTVAAFMVIAYLAYYLPNGLYNVHYLPVHYDVGGQVNKHLGDLHPLFQRFSDINGDLIFSEKGTGLFGYYFYGFIALLILELVTRRKVSREGACWLYAIAVVYFALPIMGFLLPLVDLANTTKRGLFKLFPLMLLYMGNNGPLVYLSDKIRGWEWGKKDEAVPARVPVKPAATAPVKPVPNTGKGKR